MFLGPEILVKVIAHESGRVCHDVGVKGRVVIHGNGQHFLLEPLGADKTLRVGHDRRAGHNDIGVLHRFLDRGARHDHGSLEKGRDEVGVFLHLPREVVINLDRLDLRQRLQESDGVRASLDTEADNGNRFRIRVCHVLRADSAGRPRPPGRDPVRVHDGFYETRLGFVQDHDPRDIGQPRGLVDRIAGDPLDACGINVSTKPARHGVDEAVLARVNADLGGHLDLLLPPSGPNLPQPLASLAKPGFREIRPVPAICTAPSSSIPPGLEFSTPRSDKLDDVDILPLEKIPFSGKLFKLSQFSSHFPRIFHVKRRKQGVGHRKCPSAGIDEGDQLHRGFQEDICQGSRGTCRCPYR